MAEEHVEEHVADEQILFCVLGCDPNPPKIKKDAIHPDDLGDLIWTGTDSAIRDDESLTVDEVIAAVRKGFAESQTATMVICTQCGYGTPLLQDGKPEEGTLVQPGQAYWICTKDEYPYDVREEAVGCCPSQTEIDAYEAARRGPAFDAVINVNHVDLDISSSRGSGEPVINACITCPTCFTPVNLHVHK